MWICTNDGFVSIVADRHNRHALLVRARVRRHLTSFLAGTPYARRVLETPRGDYRWRAYVARADLSDIVGRHALAIDYDNFKNSVEDDRLHRMYALWWSDHRAMQEETR